MILTSENGYKENAVDEPAVLPESLAASYHAGNVNMLKSIVEAVEASEEISREGLLEDLKAIGDLL